MSCRLEVAAGKTAVLMDVITLLASDASLVSLVRNWNAMVPRWEMAMILNSCFSFDDFAEAVVSESSEGARG